MSRLKHSPLSPRRQFGVTLIELLVAVAIIAISLTLAMPAFRDFRARASARAAADTYMTRLADERFEAVKRNAIRVVDFTTVPLPSGITTSVATMAVGGNAGTVGINPRDGMLTAASTPGTITITSGDYQLRFGVNLLGRGSVCTIPGTVGGIPGYPSC